jgi:hypothetical protein
VALALNVASDDPSGLLALAGRPPKGSAPPLSASARLTGGEQEFAVDDLHAKWGDSSLGGTLRLDLSPDKPRLEGSIEAEVLDIATLLPLFTSPDEYKESVPQRGNPLQVLANYQGTLELAAKEIRLLSQLVLRDTGTKLALADDRLRATELHIGLPRGAVGGELVV